LAQAGFWCEPPRTMRSALVFTCATGALLRARLDPFDCYKDTGENYPGLADTTKSGRKCQNWMDQKPHAHTYGAGDTGLGNHGYCRNPGASKDSPWCYTQDDGKEWEYCTVPVCPAVSETPEAWTAPEGMKSADAPECVVAEPAPRYINFEVVLEGTALEDGSCRPSKGSTNWLISNAKHEAADEEACIQSCLETAGADYAVSWGEPADDGTNCGCFRDCIATDDPVEGAVNYPSVFRLNPPHSLLQATLAKDSLALGKPCTPKVAKKEVPSLMRQAKLRAIAARKNKH